MALVDVEPDLTGGVEQIVTYLKHNPNATRAQTERFAKDHLSTSDGYGRRVWRELMADQTNKGDTAAVGAQ